MPAAQQAKASRRKQCSGYANLAGALKRPRMKGATNRSVAESIAAARNAAARMSKIAAGSKKK